ncbi:MAG: bifunctional folylpolyglutamate synthase/dihydrofolate synthase [Acidimicrobiia bacterium]|jgi:dihydrofolate synthase/folylpolyglutamate synthase|nr:bifunctional folylpolyglutamate synthase/dihydrofolate synthase [Acidimicrobiia bacterium]
MSSAWSWDEAQAWLTRFPDLEKGDKAPADGRPNLQSMQALMELLGSPQLDLAVVQITGTNGKTTTAQLAAALLSGRGRSTGLYTSPHLGHMTERIVANGEMISHAEFARSLQAVSLAVEHLSLPVTVFEIVTAAALWWFSDIGCEMAVLEVGFGGASDATSVCDAQVAVVTSLADDHLDLFGPTRNDLANEKAGIIKPDSVLVLGDIDDEDVGPFLDRPRLGTMRLGDEFAVTEAIPALGGSLVSIRVGEQDYPDVFLPLFGPAHAGNLAMALAASDVMCGGPASAEAVAEIIADEHIPGRGEIVGTRPTMLLDNAHNRHAALHLRRILDESFPDGPRTFVVGVRTGRDPADLLDALGVEDAAAIVCTEPPTPKGLAADELAASARDIGADQVAVEPDVGRAVLLGRDLTPDDGVCIITGSHDILAAARAVLN